ncbi:MAG: hypothetical protein V9E93_13730 [Steroidobacteraceae bacterium]
MNVAISSRSTGVNVVAAEPADETVQWLLVGQYRRHRHADPDREFTLAEHCERAEQEGRDGGELGRQPQALRIQSHAQHISGEHCCRDRDEAGRQHP